MRNNEYNVKNSSMHEIQWSYIDAGCGRVKFLSGNGFLWGQVGLDRKGREQVRFSELLFHSGPPRTEKKKKNMLRETWLVPSAYELQNSIYDLYSKAGLDAV